MKLPAIAGGMPQFSEQDRLNIVKPLLPPLSAIESRLAGAMQTGMLTNNGQYVRELEAAMAEYLGVEHVVAVGNATVGLSILAKALAEDEGEVIMPSFTYSATPHSVMWAGLTPRFADMLPGTYTLDPQSVRDQINEKTRLIMAVHIFGHACEIDELEEISAYFNIPLCFDAAHAFGSEYKGLRIGRFGSAEVFSFHATKIFPVGEGGAITTNDAALADKLRLLRAFGGAEDTVLAGLNGKMQEFNALIGLENMGVIDAHIEQRRKTADLLTLILSEVPGIIVQTQQPYTFTNYQNYSIQIEPEKFGMSRDKLSDALAAENVHARKYFYPALHQHTAYKSKQTDTLPVTEAVSGNILCLPMYSQMSDAQAIGLCQAIVNIYNFAQNNQGEDVLEVSNVIRNRKEEVWNSVAVTQPVHQ